MGRRSVAGMYKPERSIVSILALRFRSRAVVELENLALRHQLHASGRVGPGCSRSTVCSGSCSTNCGHAVRR